MNHARSIDDPETTLRRIAIIGKKRFLKRLYRSWYQEVAGCIPSDTDGAIVELGSGAGFFKQIASDAIASDILRLPTIDVMLDALRLPFAPGSLKAIVMVDVFHHLQDVAAFLSEAQRCLKVGGRVVMIEPWLTPWSMWIYQYLHSETCDADASHWSLPKGGPLSQANSALPWMVFSRDLQKWPQALSRIELMNVKLHTPLRYLLSGGVSCPASLPGGLYDAVKRLETLMQPMIKQCAMFATIVLTRRGG